MTRRSETGAMLIQVAITLLGLTAFSAFVFDQGILYVSKRQAQTSADAAALSGALNLEQAPDNPDQARHAAHDTAHLNAVWLEPPAPANVDVDLPIPCPPDTGTPSATPGCVKVTVHRGDAGHTNVLPTIFATLWGQTTQGIVATATAQITSGNAVQCIKPFAVPDKWADGDEAPIGGWTQTDVFNPPIDTYTAPGFTVQNDYGTELVLKTGPGNDWSAGWMQLLTFTNNGGANVIPDEISGCPDWVPPVALYDGTFPCNSDNDADPAHGCIAVKNGDAQGPTVKSGLGDLVALDPGATWDASANNGLGAVTGGCTDTTAGCTSVNPAGLNLSPRIVPIALFDPLAYWNTGCSGSNCAIRVTNLLGFFVEGTCFDVYGNSGPAYCGTNADAKKRIVGRIINYPGTFLNTGGPSNSSFTLVTRLVR